MSRLAKGAFNVSGRLGPVFAFDCTRQPKLPCASLSFSGKKNVTLLAKTVVLLSFTCWFHAPAITSIMMIDFYS